MAVIRAARITTAAAMRMELRAEVMEAAVVVAKLI